MASAEAIRQAAARLQRTADFRLCRETLAARVALTAVDVHSLDAAALARWHYDLAKNGGELAVYATGLLAEIDQMAGGPR